MLRYGAVPTVALMGTLSIYEQFRASLGEEKARVFAQTLGAMIEEAKNAATKDDIRLLRETVDANAARVDAALASLAEAQVMAEARLAGVEDRLARLEAVVAELVAAIKGLAIRSDRHEGTLLELKFRDRLPSYLGRYLRRAKVLQPADLLDEVEASLPAVGLVACEAVHPQTVAYAREQGVRIWADGVLLDERP